MLDLRDDGTIGIDFEDGQPTVVLARPKFGAYKRLRSELERVRVGIIAFQQGLVDEAVKDLGDEKTAADLPAATLAEINEKAREHSDESTAGWWHLVLVGDDTFKTIVQSGSVPPLDDWPPYLIYGQAIIPRVIEHWRRVPLAVGGKLEATMETTAE